MNRRAKAGLMSGDLIDRLHEGASAQFRQLWFEVNRLLVNQALDAGMQTNRIDVKQMLSFSAYKILWICCDREFEHTDLLASLKFLDLYRESAIWHFEQGHESDASAYATKAAHHARLILAICQSQSTEVAAAA
jgi:hypothetical protein